MPSWHAHRRPARLDPHPWRNPVARGDHPGRLAFAHPGLCHAHLAFRHAHLLALAFGDPLAHCHLGADFHPAYAAPANRRPAGGACNQALFIKDVTIPDGTVLAPNQAFTKIWRLKNTGSCTWTAAYNLVQVSGTEMGRRTSPLLVSVAPGQEMDLAVDLVAPAAPGKYQGDWMLRSGDGSTFGIGAGANKAFWVAIKVASSTSGWQSYTNPTFKISLKFPANWTRTQGDPASGERFGAADGYVAISAANAMSIDALAQSEANKPGQPYGPNPRIENLTIQGQPARLITPSTAAAPGIQQNAALIAMYPRPALVLNSFYNYLVLYADAVHVRDITDTLSFTAVGPFRPARRARLPGSAPSRRPGPSPSSISASTCPTRAAAK